MKKIVINLLKLLVLVAIVAWLLGSLDRSQLDQLASQRKDWLSLGAGFVLAFAAVCLSFYRWYLLVHALEIPFRVQDAFRLGFIGFFFNFLGGGSVGGDLLKAVFIAREQPGRRTEAVATIVVDRVVGVFGLLVVTSAAILAWGGMNQSDAMVRAICQMTLLVTAVSLIGLGGLLLPGIDRLPLVQRLAHIPRVGHILARLMRAFQVYRSKLRALAVVILAALAVHALLAVAIYLFATGIYRNPPTLSEHLIIVPLSMVAGSLPLTPGGLGTFEAAMKALYATLPQAAEADGFVVALAYRLMTFVIAGIGVGYYWFGRRDVQAMIERDRQDSAGEGEAASADADAERSPDRPSPACDLPSAAASAPPSALRAERVRSEPSSAEAEP